MAVVVVRQLIGSKEHTNGDAFQPRVIGMWGSIDLDGVQGAWRTGLLFVQY